MCVQFLNYLLRNENICLNGGIKLGNSPYFIHIEFWEILKWCNEIECIYTS